MEEPVWAWHRREAELGLLPVVDGLDAIELGCGTAYVSSWLVRRGARVVGIDNSSRQLATAAKMQDEFDLRFPLVQADGEVLPFRDRSFDFAVSEFGVGLWCDPYRWVPEAARVLRPGGRLVFVIVSAFAYVCFPLDDALPADTSLHRDYFGMHRFDWHNEDGVVDSVEFHLGYGDMIRLLRSSGFEIEDLIEIRPSEERSEEPHSDVPWEWARRWPNVEAWKARLNA
jgi:SAM-dependent methyltransferase